MEEIIYLEPDEEIPSVIEKLKNASSKSVGLVIPKGSILLQSGVNLKLLKKEALSRGITLALVTTDKTGQNLASKAGIAVYDDIKESKPKVIPPKEDPPLEETIEFDLSEEEKFPPKAPVPIHHYRLGDQAPEKEEKVSFPPEAPPSIYPKRRRLSSYFVWFGIIIILALAYLLIPFAAVTMEVKADPLEEKITVEVDANQKQDDLDRALLSGQILEKISEKEEEFSATGKQDIGEKAKGNMTVANETGVDQALEKGTSFKENKTGLIFVSLEDVTVPKATLNAAGDKVAGKAIAKVEAESAGNKYNLAESTYDVVGKEKMSGKGSIMSGGTTKTITVVSKSDIDSAKESLLAKLTEENKKSLEEKYSGLRILERATENKVEEAVNNKNVDEESDKFKLKLKVKTTALSFADNAYRKLIVNILERKVPFDKSLFLSDQDEIATTVEELDILNGTMKLIGLAKTKIIPKFDQKEIKRNIKAKSQEKALEYLNSLPNIQESQIAISPSFSKLLPLLPSRIKIKTELIK